MGCSLRILLVMRGWCLGPSVNLVSVYNLEEVRAVRVGVDTRTDVGF